MLGLIGDKEAICTRGQRAKGETVGLLLCGFGRVSRVDSCANAVLVRLSGLELLVFPTSMWEDSGFAKNTYKSAKITYNATLPRAPPFVILY